MKSIQIIDVVLDTTEMTLQVDQGSKHTVPYDQIERLEYKEIAVKKWLLFTSKVETVTMFIKGKEQSFIVRSDRFNGPFDSTMKHLRKFAEKYRIIITP